MAKLAVPAKSPVESNEAPRLTIVTVGFPPVGGGATMRMAKLAKFLSRQGWRVTVIRSEEDDIAVADPELAEELPADVTVVSVSGPFRHLGRGARRMTTSAGSSGHGAARKLAEAVKAVARSFLIPDRYVGWAWRVSRLSREHAGDPDVILSSGPPHSVHLAAARLARRLSVPFVMDLRDDWARTHTARQPAPWRRPIESRLESWAVYRAARVVHVSEASARLLADRYPRLRGRFFGIPNGFDPEDLHGLPDRAPRLTGPITFLYAGSLQGTQQLGRFPEAFGSIARQRPGSMRLRVVGPIEGRFDRTLRDAIDPNDLAIEGPVSHRGALEAMAAADVLVAVTAGGGAATRTITGKIFEYLAIRRPVMVIGPRGPATALVEKSQAGASADAGDGPGLDRAISSVVAMSTDPAFLGAAPHVLRAFDRGELARRYALVLRSASTGVDDDAHLRDSALLEDPV